MSTNAWTQVELCARMILGFVFSAAGFSKLHDLQAFADSIYTFGILPSVFVNPLALGLPILEMVTGVLLLVGVRRRACAGLAAAMSLVFALALAQALLRGLPVDCGCFGGGAPSFGKNLLALVRDVGLAVLAMIVVWRGRLSSSNASPT